MVLLDWNLMIFLLMVLKNGFLTIMKKELCFGYMGNHYAKLKHLIMVWIIGKSMIQKRL